MDGSASGQDGPISGTPRIAPAKAKFVGVVYMESADGRFSRA